MRIDVYSSSVCVCVWVCVCVCVVCDYAMNEVKCGYIYIFGWYTSLWPSVWFVSVPCETSGAFDTYLNRECIRTKETYMYMKRAVYSSTVCVCVQCIGSANYKNPGAFDKHMKRECIRAKETYIYMKRAICSSSVCACVRVRMRVCIDWFRLPVFRIDLVRGPSNKQITFQNKGAVPVQIAPLWFSQPRNQDLSIM